MTMQSTSWNTKNLGPRLAVDVFSAVGAASLVAPLISMIDRYIPIDYMCGELRSDLVFLHWQRNY
jgi:hypothetical protein